MLEVEVKILEIDRNKVEEKLIRIGARKVFDDVMEAIFFDFPDGRIRKEKHLLRLRKEGMVTILTFKKLISSEKAKQAEEYQTIVKDFDTTKEILEKLGLRVFSHSKKQRTSYKLHDAKFEFDKLIDELSMIPEFLEIETSDVETIYKYAEILGFSKDDCKPWSIPELVQFYQN